MWAALAMIAVGLFAFLYVVFAASSNPQATSGLMRFARGELSALVVVPEPPPMPLRPLQDAEGGETSLSAYAGEVMVLNLWATWCAPCVEEMPTLGALQRRYGARVNVIPISVDGEGQREKAQAELARLSDNSLPFLIDITRGVLFDVGAPGMPVTIIYDREGREVARLAGGADWAGDEAIALIDAVLAGE
jgi:thiol-disulfide isomerase/thioredoxin